MNKDFKYLLEFKEYIDEEKGEFKLLTPPDWKGYRKSRVVKAMLEQGIIKQTNDSLTRPIYVATNCNNDSSDSATNCNNEFAELSSEELFKQSIKVFNMLSYYSTTLKSKEHALSPEFLKKLADLQDDFCIALKDCGFKDRDIVKYF